MTEYRGIIHRLYIASRPHQVQSINCRYSAGVVQLEIYIHSWKSIFIRIVIELESKLEGTNKKKHESNWYAQSLVKLRCWWFFFSIEGRVFFSLFLQFVCCYWNQWTASIWAFRLKTNSYKRAHTHIEYSIRLDQWNFNADFNPDMWQFLEFLCIRFSGHE